MEQALYKSDETVQIICEIPDMSNPKERFSEKEFFMPSKKNKCYTCLKVTTVAILVLLIVTVTCQATTIATFFRGRCIYKCKGH